MERENGVSPVVGVILMMAITVILAAVIVAFVFGVALSGNTGVKMVNVTVTNVTVVPGQWFYADRYLIFFKNGDRIMFGKTGEVEVVTDKDVKLLLAGHSYSLTYQKVQGYGYWTLTDFKEINE